MTSVEYADVKFAIKELIAKTLWENHVYSVGGCERDMLLGSEIKDIDLVVDLPNGGINFAKWLEENGHTVGSVVVYEHYGTAMFRLKSFPNYEIEAVQTRKECYRNMESRKPETAYGTLLEDCNRRDFTINAIYRNLSTGESLDLTGKSIDDLNHHVIRACGGPDIIFSEDPLRILRALRFMGRLNFKIEEETLNGMKRNAERLSIVSRERITDEFSKILMADDAYHPLTMLFGEIKVASFVFPQLTPDVLDKKVYLPLLKHRFEFRISRNKSLSERLSLLFQYLPECQYIKVMREMKYSEKTIDEVWFILNHFSLKLISSPEEVRHLAHDCKTIEKLERILQFYEWNGLAAFSIIENILKINIHSSEFRRIFTYKLPVTGNDIMNELDIKEGGPIIKKILDELWTLAFKNPGISKEKCLKYVRKEWKEGIIDWLRGTKC